MKLKSFLQRDLRQIHFYDILDKKLPNFRDFANEVLVMYKGDELFVNIFGDVLVTNKFYRVLFEGGLIDQSECVKHTKELLLEEPIHIDLSNKYIVLSDSSVKIRDLITHTGQLYYQVNSFIWWNNYLKPYQVFDWFLGSKDLDFTSYITFCYFLHNDVEEAYIRLENFIRSQPNLVHIIDEELNKGKNSYIKDEKNILQISQNVISRILQQSDSKLVNMLVNNVVSQEKKF